MRLARNGLLVFAMGAVAICASLLVAQSVGRDAPEAELGREASWWGEPRSVYLQGETLGPAFELLKPLHEAVPAPAPSDWLAQHRERGQSFDEYRRGRPVRPGDKRTTIYVVRLGDFTKAEAKAVDATIAYMRLYFGVPVEEATPIASAEVPAKARREHLGQGGEQILTGYVLHKLLKPRRPDDALAMIALCKEDLWPGEGWNFVFGQASLRERVGVWSLSRNGKADGTAGEQQQFLRRTLKTATHETGHMLTIKHCLAYRCNMNGANHRLESDRNPLSLCPSCLQKLSWNTGGDPVKRMQGLAGFYEAQGFDEEAAYVKQVLTLWQEKGFRGR